MARSIPACAGWSYLTAFSAGLTSVDPRVFGVAGPTPHHGRSIPAGAGYKVESVQDTGRVDPQEGDPRKREVAERENLSIPATAGNTPSWPRAPTAADLQPHNAQAQAAELDPQRSIPARAGRRAKPRDFPCGGRSPHTRGKGRHRRLNQKADEVVRTAIERLFPADGRSPGRSPYVRGPRPNPANSSEALDPRTPGAKTLVAVSAYSADDPRRRGVGPTQTDPRTQPGQPPETGARHHSEKTADPRTPEVHDASVALTPKTGQSPKTGARNQDQSTPVPDQLLLHNP